MAIDLLRQTELRHLATEVRRAGRTVRSQTRLERDGVRRALAAALREELEPHADRDPDGLEAIGAWIGALERVDVGDADLMQELLYGVDALLRVHLWREGGLPLVPPEPRSAGDV